MAVVDGKPAASRRAAGSRPAQERRVTAALAQQVVAEPVDQHDHRAGADGASSSRSPSRPGASGTPRLRGDRGQDPGQPGGVVRRWQAGVVERGDAQRPIVADSSRAKVMA